MRRTNFVLAFLFIVAETLVAVSPASAVVCARGVVRAGCAGPNGAVVVHKAPVKTCRIVGGVRVCKTHW